MLANYRENCFVAINSGNNFTILSRLSIARSNLINDAIEIPVDEPFSNELEATFETTSYNSYSGNIVILASFSYEQNTYSITSNQRSGCDEKK